MWSSMPRHEIRYAGAAHHCRGGRSWAMRSAGGEGSSIDAIVVERDDVPAGSTALSAGLIRLPARASSARRASLTAPLCSRPIFSARRGRGRSRDCRHRVDARGSADRVACGPIRITFRGGRQLHISWPFGMRMHGLPSRTGRELIDRLRNAQNLKRYCHSC